MSFKENLREQIGFLNISAKELSARTGISVNTLNMYLGYKDSLPNVERGYKIAMALGVTLDSLVAGDNLLAGYSSSSSKKRNLQKELLSVTNQMSEFELEEFLKFTNMFASYTKKIVAFSNGLSSTGIKRN